MAAHIKTENVLIFLDNVFLDDTRNTLTRTLVDQKERVTQGRFCIIKSNRVSGHSIEPLFFLLFSSAALQFSLGFPHDGCPCCSVQSSVLHTFTTKFLKSIDIIQLPEYSSSYFFPPPGLPSTIFFTAWK